MLKMKSRLAERGGDVRCNLAISLAIEGDSHALLKAIYCEDTMNTFTAAFVLCRVRFPVAPNSSLLS
jgi:hypothetical protein